MKLSKAEYRVASLVAEGYSEKEIAAKLYRSPKTVHNQTYSIRRKWGARSAVDIARIFILNLDNPKQYFAALTFLIIQFHIMAFIPDADLRKPVRTSISRQAKRRNNEYYA